MPNLNVIFALNRDVFVRETTKDWVIERPSGHVISRHETVGLARAQLVEYGFKRFSEKGGEHWRRETK